MGRLGLAKRWRAAWTTRESTLRRSITLPIRLWPPSGFCNIGCDADPTADDWGSEAGERRFVADVLSVEDKIRESVGPSARFRFHSVPHHLAHAASAYLPSPFARAAVLAIDGIGEYDTTWLGLGKAVRCRRFRRWVIRTRSGCCGKWCRTAGFGPYGATKVMGLAAYGDPRRYEHVFTVAGDAA